MRESLRQVLFRSAATNLDLNFAGGAFSLNNLNTASVAAIPGWTFSRTDTNAIATALDFTGNVIQFPSRTNLLLQSQTFDNASWTKFSTTVTADAIAAPDGSTTADALIASNTASADHFCTQTGLTVAASTNSIVQFCVKAGAVSWVYVSLFNQVSVGVRRFFQLTGAGAVGSSDNFNGGVDAATPTIRALSNGWYLITLSLTGTSSQTSVSTRVGPASADLVRSYEATDITTPQIYVWGAQLETGSTATAYIPTTTAAVTVVLPRITNRGMLVEEARTNGLRRSDPTSATVGVIGSGGVLPTGWSAATPTGMTAEIVAKGTENGAAYLDFRFSGTNTSGSTGFPGLFFESTTQVAASTGQIWTASAAVKLVAGSIPVINLTVYEYSVAGSFLANSATSITLTSSLVRGSNTRTLSNALTAYTSAAVVYGSVNNGASLDATVRIALPQLELGAFATSPIITTGAAGARGADSAVINLFPAPPAAFTMASDFSREGGFDTSTFYYVSALEDTVSNNMAVTYQRHTNNVVRASLMKDTVFEADVTLGTGVIGVPQKVAARFAVNDVAGSFNGAAVAVDNVAAMPTASLARFCVGSRINGAANWLNGYIQRTRILPFAATNAQLQALTTFQPDLNLNFAGGAFSLNNTRTSDPAGISGWSFSRTDTGIATASDLAGNVIQFPSRTNLLLQSQTFENAAWQAATGAGSSITRTANYAAAPDESLTATRIQYTSVNFALLQQARTVVSGQVYTVSVYARSLGSNVSLSLGDDGIAPLTTINVTSSWQRFTVTLTANSTTLTTKINSGANADVLLWGAQLETGSTATTYIPTTTAAVTFFPPRITNRGILVEEARTNTVAQSISVGNTGWTRRTNYTVVSTTIDAPDGTNTAVRINNSANLFASEGVFSNNSGVANAQYACTVYARANTASAARLVLKNANSDVIVAETGFVLTSAWQRLVLVGTTAGGAAGYRFEISTDGVVGSIDLWGAQVEAGAFATSLIITTGAAGARGADRAFLSVNTWLNPNAFTLAARVNRPFASSNVSQVITCLTTNPEGVVNQVQTGFRNLSNNLTTTVRAASTEVYTPLDQGTELGVGVSQSVALALSAASGTLYLNRTQVNVDTSITMPTGLARLCVGNSRNDIAFLNGYVEWMQVFNSPLSDTQLQALTS